jgi:SAM-dependent methyltransferase
MGALSLLVDCALILLLMGLVALQATHLYYSVHNRVPFVRAPREALAQIRQVLDLPERGVLWDLGCGDGRVLAAIGAGQEVWGIDNNPLLLAWARRRLGRRAHLVRGELLEADLRRADRVFCYLGPETMASLEPKFWQELPAGARVVSLQFPLPSRTPDQVIELERKRPYARTLYVYDY